MVPKSSSRGRTEKRRVIRHESTASAAGKSRSSKGVDSVEEESLDSDTGTSELDSDDDDEPDNRKADTYSTLLESLGANENDDRPRKRRRLSNSDDHEAEIDQETGSREDGDVSVDGESDIDEVAPQSVEDDDDDLRPSDPYNTHFPPVTDDAIEQLIQQASGGVFASTATEDASWKITRGRVATGKAQSSMPLSAKRLPLKQKLQPAVSKLDLEAGKDHDTILSTMFNYEDLLYASRSATYSPSIRDMTSLHVLNHILKGRDRVLRNSAKATKADHEEDDSLRDQGFTRPKVLFLLETRQQVYEWASAILSIFEPEQKENWSRFKNAFYGEPHLSATMPEDYLDLFDGNSDNDFRLGLKFTRKTVKFFAAFYSADILFCSPLGLRRIIANPEPKKRDSDFLSSIEMCIFDQTHAMQMQNWSHVTFCVEHLNLQPKDAHGADFNRVKTWYLDGHARYFRQTLIFTSYITPEITNLFNTHCRNISGRVKLHQIYAGTIQSLSTTTSIKQTFSRFDCPSPLSEPDGRFTFFTSAILPTIVKQASLSSTTSPSGILLFIPSYLDFVRVRNHFAASTATENISFGQLSEYSSVSESRRARSHLVSGRNSVLVYSGRAHHFHRYRIAGVKRVYWYGLPDDEGFYDEVLGFVGKMITDGKVNAGNVSSRAVFTKWDALRLERIVGSSRVRQMIGDKGGDTFEFV